MTFWLVEGDYTHNPFLSEMVFFGQYDPTASLANKPHLSGLRVKVKAVRKSGYDARSAGGVRVVIKPEDASYGDEFVLHFRVRLLPRKRPRFRVHEIDDLLIVEQDTRGKLAP